MISRLVSLLVLATFISPVLSSPFLPFEASYQITKKNEVVANTFISLKQNGDDTWDYQSTSRPTSWLATILGITVTETSHWRWQDNQIQILDYRYHRSGREKEIHLSFNWQTMTVINTIDSDHWKMSIPEGTLDKLSINLGLMSHLSKQISDASFPVADGGKLKYYDFKVEGAMRIQTALGNIKTIKITRNKRGKKDRPTILWLAPDFNFLLVRKEKKGKDGEKFILEIKSLNNS